MTSSGRSDRLEVTTQVCDARAGEVRREEKFKGRKVGSREGRKVGRERSRK